MVLEIRHRRRVLAVERRLPSPGIPRPADALRGSADRRSSARSAAARWSASPGRHRRDRPPAAGLVGARLVRRLHRVDRIEIRRQVAVIDEFRRAVERRFRRVAAGFSETPSASTTEIRPLAGLLSAFGIDRRAGADQQEMVEERPAERAHEEIVGEHVFLGDLPQRQLRAVIVAHDQARRNRPRRRTCRSCRRRSASAPGRSDATDRGS